MAVRAACPDGAERARSVGPRPRARQCPPCSSASAVGGVGNEGVSTASELEVQRDPSSRARRHVGEPHFVQEAGELELRARCRARDDDTSLQGLTAPARRGFLLRAVGPRRLCCTGMSVKVARLTEGTSRTLTTLPSMNPNWRRASMASSSTAAGVVVRQCVDQQASTFGNPSSLPRRPGRPSQNRLMSRGAVSTVNGSASGPGAAVRELHVCHRVERA